MRCHTKRALLASAALLLSLAATTHPGYAQGSARADVARDEMAQALLDTIAARVATLEVARAALLGVGKAATDRDVTENQKQLDALRQYVDELPQPQTARAYVNEQVARALDARLASVNVNRRLLATVHAPNDQELQALAATAAALARRRTELRAQSVGAGPGPQG